MGKKMSNPFAKIGAIFKKIGGSITKVFKKIGDGFKLIGQAFKCLGKVFDSIGSYVTCGLAKLINLPKCLLYYFLDTLFSIFIDIPIWFIGFLLAMISKDLSKGYYKIVKYIGKGLMYVDGLVHSATKLHVFRYQDTVLDRCYRCKNLKPMPNFKKIKQCIGTLKKGVTKSCDAIAQLQT